LEKGMKDLLITNKIFENEENGRNSRCLFIIIFFSYKLKYFIFLNIKKEENKY
jgi:hypothetical protein